MEKYFYDENFDVEEVSSIMCNIMSKWSIFALEITGPIWVMYDYDGKLKYFFKFEVDFSDIEVRIKLEDLKLNVIHHIESLKDDTTYHDNLSDPLFIK